MSAKILEGPKKVKTFVGQVVRELKKVIYPKRKELLKSVGIVLAFVIGVTALVLGIDTVMGQATLWMFGE